jgi:NADPH:quinone reductase-like Zn-dependent oxidoreductase
MRAITYESFGSVDVLNARDIPIPVAGPGEVLVRVVASSVTTADWRLRAAAFPGSMWLAGRLMFGIFRPRKPVLGGDFSGVVEAVGNGVTAFAVGDRVFGFSGTGAHAEYLTIKADGAIAPAPDTIELASAAALPFGALSALVFLRDYARVKPGTRVLIIGATGGVGAYAVQIARILGAEVTAVGSASNLELATSLGANRVIDYRVSDPVGDAARYDVIFDTVGAVGFRQARAALASGGLFVPLNFRLGDVVVGLVSRVLGNKRMLTSVSGDNGPDLRVLAEWVDAGKLRPVIDRRYPMDKIADAYLLVEGRHRKGSVLLEIAPEDAGDRKS